MDATLSFLPYIVGGLVVTILTSLMTFSCAVVIGLAATLWLKADRPAAKLIIRSYVTIFRSLPELLCIFIVYYGCEIALRKAAVSLDFRPISISPLLAVTVAIGIQFGAYCVEILSDAHRSIRPGLLEAGHAIGLSPRKVTMRVTIPLMLQAAIPGLGNLFLVMLKVSALASVIGLEEVTRRAKIVAGSTREPFASYLIAAALFLAIAAAAALLQSFLERSLRSAREA
ncbi:ABC transporter permease subunit [Sinorhizobium americanum]|uniref:Polar amino acid transport system permease protein n=1 Tax=Sinorhizobium americanum TaxID=194963 RepID=A0A4R2B1S1_9HYPH|nr:ABC transporter permease subunit [Sinorhizobium americanum]TCN20381.1 polar amino acid transport system permease protein [Sinorhizobium americanum]